MKKFFLLWVLCVMLVNVWAIPARRGGVMITQPDGSEIMVYQHGDEYFHWMTNEKGEWLIKDANGSYQVTDSLSTEKIIARRKNAPRQKENVGTLNLSPRGLVILVNYQDVSFTTSADEMYNMLMGKNYSRDYTYVRSNKTYVVKSEGSAQKYFYDASNGQYQPKFDIVGPVTLSQNMAYYGANDGNGNDVHPALMVAEACELVNGSVDFTQYDNDNDGVVDFVYVYYAGYGEADGGGANTIWPHAWQVSAEKQLKLDGKKIDVYACSNELDYTTNVHTGIGTFCHEFSHVLGLPDLYATNGASHKTLDSWDIMDCGSYNNECNTPPTYSAYERFYMGWLTPRLIVESENVVLDELQNSNSALLISTTDNHNLVGTNPSPTTFYILENRQQKAWDEFLPWSGMMLTKIQYNSNKWYNNVVNNTASSMGVDLIEADGITDKTKAGDLFPAGATEYLGIDNHPIKNIKDKNGVITFSYKNAIPDEEEEQDEYKDYIRVTDITTLKDYDRVVLYCDGNAVGVTGWNGSRDALVAESGWVEFVVETTDDGVYLKDMSACAYIASPGTSNQFVYGTKAVCNVNEDGVLTCNNRYFVANGTYYRMYTNINSYDPFYVYKVIPRNENVLTYNVTVPVGTNACYIAGDMNGWTFTEMNKVDATHYTITLQDATTTMEYKYCSGPSWDYGERAGNNRKYSISDIVEEWAAVYNPEIDNEGSELKEITVKAHVPASWTDQITAWVWHTGGEGREVVPTKDGDWYVVTENCAELNIIYKNGAGWNGNVNQTMDMTFSENTCIDITANAGTLATYTIVDCIDTDSASGVIFDPEVDKGNASSDSNSAAAYSVTKNGVTMNVSTGIVGTTNNITHYRIYKGQTLTLSSTVGNIVSVEFSCTSTGDYGPAGFTTTIGTYDYLDATGTWTGNAPEIVFTATNNQVRASKITVTLESDSLPTQEVVDCIYYTSTGGNIVTPYKTDVFGANIVSNTYENGQGVITFDGPVTSIGHMAFNACMTLKSIIIPNSVTTIDVGALSACYNLTSITIGRGVTSIDANAIQPVRLTSIVVDAENPTYDSRDNCNAIIETATNTLIQGCQKTVIPQSVTHIGKRAFAECDYLSSITIPNSVVSIGEDAFYSCKSLTSITIPNSVTNIGLAAFSSCDKLTSMIVEATNPVYDSRENCNAIVETATNTLIAGCQNTIIPQSVIHIGEYAFSSCNISSITIPNSVTTIGKYAFAYSDIASITIPNSVINIREHAFDGCTNLTSITIPNSVKDIELWTFANCSSLNSITLHDGITTIGEHAFINCPSLTSVTIPNSVTSIGLGAFRDCKALTSIVVDSGNTTYDSRENCNAIIKTGSNTLIAGCQNTIIPNSVTKIYLEAFRGCSTLTAINIPNSVTSIGGWAFSGCSLLDTIYIEATTPPTLEYNNVFTGTPSPTCYIPCGTLAAYQASEWANQVGELVEEECEETKEITVKARVPASWTDSIFVWVWPTGGEGVELIPEKQDDWYVFTQKGEELNIIFKNGRGWLGEQYQSVDMTFTESTCVLLQQNESSKATYVIVDCEEQSNKIYYTSTDGNIVTPYRTDVFGANIVSNTYENGQGVITFDGSVTSIGDYAFNKCSYLKSISLPESIIAIEDSAFYECSTLVSVSIPNGVRRIGKCAFQSCKSLLSIDLPDSITTISECTFQYCSKLSSVSIPTAVTEIGSYAFCDCAFDTILLPTNLTRIKSGAFSSCSSLKSIIIPEKVQYIENFAFIRCSSLKSITIPQNVIGIGERAFVQCPNLMSIVVDPENTVYDSRENCNAIIRTSTNTIVFACQNTTFPKSVTRIGAHAFEGVDYLKNINIPTSIKGIGEHAFDSCDELFSVTFHDSITAIERYTFQHCESLKIVTLGKLMAKIDECAFCSCSALDTIFINAITPPALGKSVFLNTGLRPICIIPCGTFAAYQASDWANEAGALVDDCENFIPDSSYYIYYTTKDSSIITFNDKRLFDANIVSNTYENGQGIITFDRPLTNIGGRAFDSCKSLTSVTLPNSVTSIDAYAFYECTSLASITIPHKVISIGDYAFYNCKSLKSMSIPNSVTNIGEAAFSYCFSLASISISNSVTVIEGNAFFNCPSLSSIVVESGNTIYDSRENCNAIIETTTNTLIAGCQNTVIPNDVTSIGEFAFYGCSSLTSITIPNSITNIDYRAFAYCDSLEIVYVKAINPPTLDIYDVFYSSSPTCYIPCGTLAAYQSSEWRNQVGTFIEEKCEDIVPDSTYCIFYTSYDGNIVNPEVYDTDIFNVFGANIISNTYENGVGTITFDRPLTTIGDNAFGFSGYYLTSIKLPNTVTSIGSGAFWGCYYLTEFTIPENVTTIGRDAFSSCEALTEITIPKSVTSIEPQIFNRCPSLIKITIEEGNEKYDSRDNCNAIIETATNKLIEGCKTTIIPNTVTSIGESAFSGCENLSSITIPNSVTSIEVWAFAYCYALDVVFIDAITPPSLIYNYTLYKYEVFNGKYPTCYVPCGTLAAYQASDWAKEGVSLVERPCENNIPRNQIQYTSSDANTITPNIEYMTEFDAFGANIVSNTYENGVGTITFDGAVSRIGYQSFSNSETLTSITFPDSLYSIDYEAFRNCDRLKFITIPDGVYGIWDYAFGECDSLVAVNIPASVEYIGYNAFESCYQLASVELSEGLRQIGDYAFRGCSKLTSLTLPNSLQYLGQSALSGCGFSTFTIPTGITSVPAYLFMYCTNLQSVTLNDNVTAIEDGAFSDCQKLTSINIPNSVTSIGFGAFSGTGIRSIVLPENITTINGNTFYGCTNLTSIILPNKVTTIKESAFSGCKNMKSVLLSNSLTSIEGNAFYDCMSLEALYIPKSVTSISNYAFSNCESLQSIVVENGNSIYDSRNNCNAIIETATNTLISGCQTTIIPKDVISVGDYAFVGQKKLTTIAFPSSVAKIGVRAFDNCSNLKTIIFGNQVDSIAQRAFENCLAIDDIYSYSLQPPVLSENALAYYDANLYVPCSALADYQVADKWNQFTYVQCIDTMYFNITNDTVRPYTVEVTYGDILYAGDVFIPALVMIDDEVYHVTNIGDSAFYDCSSLTSVSIPESVVSVDPNSFTSCTSLDTITIKATTPPTLDNSGISSNPVCKIPCHTQSVYEASNWNNHVKNFEEQCDGYYIYYTSTDGNVVRPYKTDVFNAKIVSNTYEHGIGIIAFDKPVRRIGEMAFADCWKLSSITIPNTVLIIDDKAFFSCSSLVDITLPNSVKIIGSSAFYDCSSLTSITIPNSVTSIGGYAFGYCSSITSMVVPNSVTTIGKNAFANCKALTSINIPNTITKLEDGVFEFCTSMTSIVIPNSIASIGKSAFSHCTSLSAINIPNSVVYLGSSVFSSCTSLTSFTIPNSIDTLARSLFTGCTSLSTIHIPNSVTVIDNQAFSDCSSLTAVTIGENVISIGGWAFDNCSSLISITIPNSVTNIGKYAFSDCDTLKTVYVEATVPPTLSGNIFYNTTPPTCHIPCGTLAAYQASDWANQVGELVEECEYEDLIPTNQIQYTTWDDEIVRIDTTSHIDYINNGVDYYSMFGANIISNTYENGVGTITFDAPVTVIGRDVFNNSNLRTIILPNSISTIETNAFAHCGSLQSITLPRNLKSIGYGAFRMCSQLQSIEFPEGLESIEGRAFESCFNGIGYYATGGSYIDPNGGYIGSGISISIPSSVTSIGEGVFAWCSGISSIVVDGNNTTYDSREDCNAIVETATNTMIAGCRNSFIPNSVTVLGYGVFYGHSIKSVEIPNGVVSIGESAFAYSSIDTLHIPSSVKTIGRMAFDHCDDLTTLTLSEGLETIEYCGIYCCYALKSIVFPSTLKSIGGYGVSYCSSMTSVEFLSTTPPAINNDYYGCFWKTPCEFTVPCGTKDAYYTALNADAPSGYHIDSLKVKEKEVFAYSIVSGDIEQGLVFITKHATYCDDQTLSFYAEPAEGSSFVKWSDGCTDKERNITLTQDTTIVAEFSSMNCIIASGTCGINGDNLMWQLSCDSILSIMGEGEMSGYSYDDHGINPPWTEYASQIKSIVVKEGVTSIGTYAFFNYGTAKYSSLQDITIPASLTKTGANVFSGLTSMNAVYITDLEAWMNISHSSSDGNPLCSAHHLYVNGVELEELVLPEGTTSVSEYVFYGCKGLKSLQLPNSIELIENSAFAGTGLIDLVLPEGLEVVDNSAFRNCLSLEKLYISSTVRRLGNCAFEGCDSLKGVYITDLEAWCNLTIEYSSPLTDAHHLYLNDIELTEIVFPENCSKVKDNTFEGCSYIKSIQLHDNITSIGSYAFHGCSSLESLVIPASVSYIGSCQFWDCTALKQIKFLSSTPPEISQGAVVFYRTNTDIMVPCGSKDEYIAVINSPDQELYWIDTNRIIEQQSYIYSITTSNPSQGSICYLHEPANCEDLTITFRADAANGYRFVRWSDGNTENPRTLLLTQDTYLTAEFETSVCNVNVWCDTTRGFVIGSGTYAYGTTVTLSAHANEGYRFARWSDNITETPRTITLYQDITLRADFMDYSETNLTICESELPYIWYNQSLTATGKYTYTKHYAGTDIDSVQHILNLTVNPTVYAEETITACDSYTWNGETYTQSGEYVYTTTATNGCDSIVTLHLTINHSGVGATEYATICYGETYIWNGQTYSDAGEYSVTLSNTLGCDSVATLQLTIMPEAVTTTETVVVGSDELPYRWRGNTYAATGRYTDVEQYAAVACDSAIHVLDLTVLTTGKFDEQSVTICETETPYTWYGEAYSATGKYTYTEQYVGTDIDSIQHVLNLTVNPTIYTEEHITACDSYTWNGETYTTSGEYVYTTVATNGCDSIVTLHLTVSSTTYASEQATICYGDTYTWNGQTYATAGAYSITLQNANGCDSIVTLHLTVLPEVPVTIETATIYDGEEYIWHDESYFEEGEYSITLQNINGCDSVITLILTVLPIYENEWSLLQEIRDDLIQNNAWQTPWDLSTSVSSWPGVELYKGHVIEIDLSSQGLTGTFPTKILQLPHLEYLSLADNLLTGEAFAKMQTDMTTFVAENPTFLSALIYLDISYNQFTGNVGIIAAMSNFMPNLSFLQANNNRFRDVVPVIPQKIDVDLSEQDINHYVHMDASELNIDPTQLPTIMLYDHVGQTYFTSPIAVDITNYSPDYTYSHDNPWGIMIDKTNDYMLCLNGDAYRGKNGDTLYLSYPYSEVSHYSYCRMTLSFEMGDANFVDGVNIADLQTTILYAFGEYNDCVFNFTAADTYTDNKINVQDVIRTVGILVANAINNTDSIMMNHIAPREQQSSADAEIFVDNNAIKVVTTRPIAALQINFKGNAQWKMNDLGMEQTATQHTVVAYSLTGNNIPVGETIIGYCQGNVDLLHAELSDADARLIPVTISGQRMPTATEDLQTTDNEQAIYDVLGRKHNQINQQGLYIIKSNNQYIKVFNYNK